MAEIKSLKRALDIINLFSVSRPELGISEAAKELRLNKSTASRLMATMHSAGILHKSINDRKYCLSSKVTDLARIFLSNLDLKELAAPYIKELNQKTNQLVLLHIIKDNQRFCLYWLESTHPIRRVVEKEHIYGPLHAGAPSKLLLSYLPDDIIDKLIEKTGLPRYTDLTITNREDLLQEIKKIRHCGLAISRGEQLEFTTTASAPVRNYAGQVIAALSISWIQIHDTPEKEVQYVSLVKETAHKISRALGYEEQGLSLINNY